MKFIIALDVSRGKSNVVLYEETVCLSEFEISHNKSGFQILLDVVNSCFSSPDIVYESTGIYSKVIDRFCEENHLTFYCLNPYLAKRQLDQDTLRSFKTDKHDAHKLAQSHLRNVRIACKPQTPNYASLRHLSRFYTEIDEHAQLIRMRLHNAIEQCFPELNLLIENRILSHSLPLIQMFPHPDLLLKYSPTKIKNFIIKNAAKKISHQQAKDKAIKLIAYAKNSYPAVSVENIQVEKVRYYAQLLEELLAKKHELSLQIIRLARSLKEFHFFTSFPGIGEISAALLLGELGDLKRFDSPKKVNAYIGIDIRRHQSGTFMGTDRINKRGNPNARRVFYFVVTNMLKQQRWGPNHIVDYYYKLKGPPYSKKHKVAIIACINKLIKCLYAMVIKGSIYDYHLASVSSQ